MKVLIEHLGKGLPLFYSVGDYKKFKSLLEVGEALYIEGYYQLNWSGKDYVFNVSDIRLLDSIGEEMTNSITIRIPVNKVSQQIIDHINQVCQSHKGAHKLKVQIYDRDEDILLNLVSKAKRVKADNLLITELEKFGLKYKLN